MKTTNTHIFLFVFFISRGLSRPNDVFRGGYLIT